MNKQLSAKNSVLGAGPMIEENALTADQFCQLFSSVGWDAPPAPQAKVALDNSLCVFSLHLDDSLVGMARILGDRSMSFYLKDFLIMPTHQGKGLGTFLMRYIEAYIREQLPPGWAASFELISSKDKEVFYESFGFERRPCEWDGAGMFKMIQGRSSDSDEA